MTLPREYDAASAAKHMLLRAVPGADATYETSGEFRAGMDMIFNAMPKMIATMVVEAKAQEAMRRQMMEEMRLGIMSSGRVRIDGTITGRIFNRDE